MTAVSYHDTVKDVQGLGWSSHGPFARLAWFALLEEHGKRPFIALARDGEQAAALCLHLNDGRLESLTNWYAFTWADLQTAVPVAPAALAQLARALAKRTQHVELTKLPGEDGTADRLEAAFRQSGWWVRREACDTNHSLPVAGRSYAAYLADRPGPLRTTLKRKSGKLDVSIAREFSPEDWAHYEAIYADSWKPEEGDPALLRQFAEGESAAGRYRLGIARHEGTPIAAQFWTVDEGTAYIHKLAHRQDATALSPGTVLTAALIEHVIDADKVEFVDFGTGDDAYKRDWMELHRPRYRLTCLRPDAPRNWPIMGKAFIRKLVSGGRAG